MIDATRFAALEELVWLLLHRSGGGANTPPNFLSFTNDAPMDPAPSIVLSPPAITLARSGILSVSISAFVQLTGTAGHRVDFQPSGPQVPGQSYSVDIPAVADEGGNLWSPYSTTFVFDTGGSHGDAINVSLTVGAHSGGDLVGIASANNWTFNIVEL